MNESNLERKEYKGQRREEESSADEKRGRRDEEFEGKKAWIREKARKSLCMRESER